METISGPPGPFTPEQRQALSKPLDLPVKQRSQAGRSFNYIEGHEAIRKANEIFSFDGWDQSVRSLKQVQEVQVDGKWRVGYTATVMVTVGQVVREDVGFGQGIDKDLGQAHESAVKEAVTDGLKRALRTFGNQFGLSLYDKDFDPSKVEKSGPGTVDPTPEQIAQMKALAKSAFKDRADYNGFLSLAGGAEKANSIFFTAVKEGKTSRDQINQLLIESKAGQ